MLHRMRALRREVFELRYAMRESARAASSESGRSALAQAIDMVRLRLGPGCLHYGDYYKLRLYRPELTRAEKLRYVGNKALARRTRWDLLADDKLLGYTVLHALGVRTPRVLALVHPFRRFLDRATLRDAAAVRAFLLTARYPFVSKPVDGMFSHGFAVLEGVDAQRGTISLGDGRQVPIDAFAAERTRSAAGVIFQELLLPHPQIAAEISPRLCTLRIIVTLDERGARLFRAIWKITGEGNDADNYWHSGNMMAKLDQETGAIEQVITGLGPRFSVVERHPRTGRALRGFRVPCYREAVALTLAIAPAFSGLALQAWDVAITPDGPVPMEINDIGSMWVPQAVYQEGLLADAEFRRAMRNVRS
jgi:hypothetical protein